MVTTDFQPRQPGGNLRGGEFAEKQNSAPGGPLMESATGSFAFPPSAWDSAEQQIEFFTTAPISDRVLSNADHAYRQWRQTQIDNAITAKYSAWGEDPATVELAGKNPAEYRQQNARYKAELEKWAEEQYPRKEINQRQLRTILRAHQIRMYKGSFDTAEQQSILGHRMMVGKDEKTVAEIVDEYSTLGWADRAMTENDLANTDALYRVAMILDAKDGIFDNKYEPSR